MFSYLSLMRFFYFAKDLFKKPREAGGSIFFYLKNFFKAVFCALLLFPALSAALPFEGRRFVISGPCPYSAEAAKAVYRRGGGLADMAAAAALALAVTRPYYVSLGAGGFALIKIDSEIEALDFRETAPAAMTSDFFEKTGLSSRSGGASAGVPGFLAGILALHEKHGKLSWAEVVRPAIALAEKGFRVSGDWAQITNKSKGKFNEAGSEIFFNEGRPYKAQELFKQPRLARALRLIQRQKAKAFYQGPIGRDILSALKEQKGLMSEQDLKDYKVKWRKPLSVSFRGYQVYSMPLPSSGGIILSRALKLIEKRKLYKKEIYSLGELHLLAEVMARAFRPRALMGDPAFSNIKEEGWLSDKGIEKLSKTISLKKSLRLPPLKEPKETTHISLMDSRGAAASLTITLNGFYGSHVVSKKYGIVLNNQIDDFTTIRGQGNMFGLIQGRRNAPEGGKRPLSSMTPVIVEKNREAVLALGGAGGPKIISAVLQTLYRRLVNKLNLEEALMSPRLHHQFRPSHLFIESKRFNPELITSLKMKGHRVRFKDYIAQVFAVSRNLEKESLSAAHEHRREGASGGL